MPIQLPQSVYSCLLATLLGSVSLTGISAQTLSKTTDPIAFGDDVNTSTMVLYTDIQYTCPWIDTGITDFKKANPGWDFTYAGPTAAAFLKNDLKVVDWYPWVVNQPTYTRTFTNPDRTRTWGGNLNGETGGGYISLSYTPQGTDPTNIHWIQGIDALYHGDLTTFLDNPDDRTSPFYDVGTQDIAGTTYFVDIPGSPENEYESNPVANWDFQAFIAQDNGAANGFDHNVTIYGGVWYRYTYSATDTPEPGAVSLGMAGLLVVTVLGRLQILRSKKRTA